MAAVGASKGKQPEVLDLTAPAAPFSSPGSGPRPSGLDTAPRTFRAQGGARKLTIKNLRTPKDRAAKLDEYYARTWADLEAGLASILAGTAPAHPLERLYRGVEDLCLHSESEALLKKLQALCEAHLVGVVLVRVQDETRASGDVDTLRAVYAQWLVWQKTIGVVRSTFSYLDRTYLLAERSLPSINDMLVSRFRRAMFGRGVAKDDRDAVKDDRISPLGRRVLGGMCALVDQDRRGDAAFDHALLLDSVRMVHVFNVYTTGFEPVFLRASQAFIEASAQHLDATAELPMYVRAADALIRSEVVRCNTYSLDSSTKVQLKAAAKASLIVAREAKLLADDDVARLVREHDAATLGALYDLLRVAGLHRKLLAPWGRYIEATGRAIVTDTDKADEMVVRLLLLRRALLQLVRTALGRDDAFTYALREAFGHFVNDDAVAAAHKSSASKVGEMIAKYMDMLLRGGLRTLPPELLAHDDDGPAPADDDGQLERQLDHALELFRFVHGKDVFEAFYKRDLARRLLMGRSTSDDAERYMLGRLRTECGSTLTQNLEKMFRDIQLSRDEMDAFAAWRETAKGRATTLAAPPGATAVDLHVNVLSAAAWPTYPATTLNVPPDAHAAIALFDAFYKDRHGGRTLTWVNSLAHCTLRARFNRGTKELSLSSYQAAVLVLFNDVEDRDDGVLSYAQIAEATGLAGGDLARTLQSLACGKLRVLAKHPKGRDIAPTDTFTVNKGFWDARARLKINQIQLRETRAENAATYERVSADRQLETQAAIVRIMKSRKTLPHAQLVAEVISQTQSRGALDPAEIKKNIEKLIEKDYLEREEGSYVYLA